MAIKLNALSQGTIEVVASCDPALDMTEDEYKEYQKTLDKSLLKIKDGDAPTVFVMRKTLPYKLSQRIKNRQMSYENGEVFVGTSHISDEVRAALIDVINPPHVPLDDQLKFKKDGDGSASPDIMALLDASGITADLYVARKLYLEGASGSSLKKS